MPLVNKVDHIAVAVKDLEKALRFYTDVLGLEVTLREELPDQGVRAAFVRLDNLTIELMEPLDESSPLARWIARYGQGMAHLCFQTDDLDAVAAELIGRDMALLGDTSRGADKKRVVFLHPKDNAGVMTEFAQLVDKDG